MLPAPKPVRLDMSKNVGNILTLSLVHKHMTLLYSSAKVTIIFDIPIFLNLI